MRCVLRVSQRHVTLVVDDRRSEDVPVRFHAVAGGPPGRLKASEEETLGNGHDSPTNVVEEHGVSDRQSGRRCPVRSRAK